MDSNSKKMVLKIACIPWENQSRDKRELSVCRELGYDVAVLAKGNINDKGRVEEVDGFKVYRYTTKPFGEKVPSSINKLLSFFMWAKFARELSPYAISGHNILGLGIGWMSGWFLPKSKKPKLIYDSHEFELERNTERSKFHTRIIGFWEKFLMRRCVFSIMVNDSIADEVQKIHGLEERPVVVRSTPNLWQIDETVCQEKRKEFLRGLEISEGEDSFLIMYHGGLMEHRGIETDIRAVASNPNVCLIVLGNGNEQYLVSLKELAKKLGVSNRILFHSAVPFTELWKYVGAVDLGMVMIEAVVKNHYYSLPNKFFENIQSLTPMVTSFFPELKRIMDQYEIGLTCDPENLEAVNACVERMRTDKAMYARCKENMMRAKKELCWENEKQIMLEAYSRI